MFGLETITPAAAVKLLGEIHKQGWLDKVFLALKQRQQIAVFGSSGTGKSQLLLSLIDPLAPAISRINGRTERSEPVAATIEGRPFLFWDTPGQTEYFVEREDVVIDPGTKEQLFRKRYYNGVVNVVSYGYHEGKQEKLSDVFVDPPNNYAVRQDYLDSRTAMEIKLLCEWAKLRRPDRIRWVITVVSKADLWWQHADVVEKYYTDPSGAYVQALQLPAGVTHHVFPYSAKLHKFYDMQPLPGFLDEDGRLQLQAYFIKKLMAIAK